MGFYPLFYLNKKLTRKKKKIGSLQHEIWAFEVQISPTKLSYLVLDPVVRNQ